jgi:tRNA-binding EMAP/Myf-like protein
MKTQINFSQFLEIEKQLEIQVGTVVAIEEVPKSEKLLKMEVKFKDSTRTVVTNIKPHLKAFGEMLNMNYLFVTNLIPTKIMGIESGAMILPGEIEECGIPLSVNNESKIIL